MVVRVDVWFCVSVAVETRSEILIAVLVAVAVIVVTETTVVLEPSIVVV